MGFITTSARTGVNDLTRDAFRADIIHRAVATAEIKCNVGSCFFAITGSGFQGIFPIN
jgi:hypothetical protein